MLDRDLVNEAKQIVEQAEENGITLRVMGAAAIRMHLSRSAETHEKMDRRLSDLDFVCLSREKEKVLDVLPQRGYVMDRAGRYVMVISQRCFFEKPENGLHVDVFFDKLDMCHTIDLRDRLLVDSPTISLADLLLEKMQIVEITEKDLKDTLVLLADHAIAGHDKESINSDYVSKLLGSDWGFYYTVTENLRKARTSVGSYEALSSEVSADIVGKIDHLLRTIENEPKSTRWKMRARIGTRQKWYKEVESPYGTESLTSGR